MTFTKFAALSVVAFGLAVPALTPAVAQTASVKSVDTDSDGTIDLAEAKKAAMAHFAKMDADHEGTIDSKEAGMDVTALDGDKDGTLDKAEFESALTATFKATDTDNDGTVDAKELASAKGKTLAAMMN